MTQLQIGTHAIISNTNRGEWGDKVIVWYVWTNGLVSIKDNFGNQYQGPYHPDELTQYNPDLGVVVNVEFKPWQGS